MQLTELRKRNEEKVKRSHDAKQRIEEEDMKKKMQYQSKYDEATKRYKAYFQKE